ncbi:MAG: TIR domain-containing protein [Thermoanaerobaculia bacterium]
MKSVLEPAQQSLLRTLVAAARSLPVERRQSFYYHHVVGGDPRAVLTHPGLSGDTRALLSDLKDLADEGLLRLSQRDPFQGSFDITLMGFRELERPSSTQPERARVADPAVVWVVYGRNEAARKAMFDFLRSLGLKPTEWDQAVKETGKGSPFVGEVLDTAFATAQAFVILLTGDDEARLRPEYRSPDEPPYETSLGPQARPNVLFEAGRAFGADADRTVIVQLGDVKPFSDIAGRHLIRMDNSVAKRQALADRLRTAGCAVNTTGTDWHTAGAFMAAILPHNAGSTSPTDAVRSTVSLSELTSDQRRLLQSLSARGQRSATLKELSTDLGIPENVVGDSLARLDDYGFLDSTMLTREGSRYRLSDQGRAFTKNERLS